jgi:hypothetical protein
MDRACGKPVEVAVLCSGHSLGVSWVGCMVWLYGRWVKSDECMGEPMEGEKARR